MITLDRHCDLRCLHQVFPSSYYLRDYRGFQEIKENYSLIWINLCTQRLYLSDKINPHFYILCHTTVEIKCKCVCGAKCGHESVSDELNKVT